MRIRSACFLLLGLPAVAAAQSESFVVRSGLDTIAIENFVRSGNRLEGELSAQQMRTRYIVELSNGQATSLQVELIAQGQDTALMKSSMRFVRDSVYVQNVRGGVSQPAQRLVTRPGAVPFINLAFSLLELITTRQRGAAGDTATAQLFALSNGSTLPARVTWVGADSAVVTVANIDLRLHVDARGRILRGAVPSQNVTIERVAGTLNRSEASAPDYSAPANAPYTAEPVVIKTPAGHTLAGTLTMPKARAGRIPAVITITGSGPQDRDETLQGVRGYRPFREFADDLARRGVAVLRYDDRGFGASTGVFASATSADFADDTRAVLAFLRSRPEIDPARVFLLGHSEGGLIAPMVAAEDSTLAGIVLLAGPAYTGRRILEYQTRHGLSLQTERTQAERDSIYQMSMATLNAIDESQPWMRFFRDFDPLPVVRRVRVPVLIVQGATDRQVTADQANVLADALQAAGNGDVAVHVLPDVNHLFLSDPVGNASGYSSLRSRTLVPQVLQIVGDWISNQSK